MKNHKKKVARASASALLGFSLALPLAAIPGATAAEIPVTSNPAGQPASTTGKISSNLDKAEGSISVFVKFKGEGAYSSTQPQTVLRGEQEPVDANTQVQGIERSVESQAQQVADQASSEILYTTHNVMRGVALTGDAESLLELAKRSDVERISRIIPKERNNAGTVIDTEAINTWQQTGKTGKDIKVAVIDSGIDYTHATFGGPGTDEAYEEAKASTNMPAADSGLYDPEKYIGGYDFAGDDYTGSNPAQPDNNPLDCELNGHGTHVAGTAVGYGVNKDGTTFDGNYNKLTASNVKNMKVAPGSAPEAQLMGFRVFGCDGSTNLTGQALDAALDPNGDGDFSDKADIVNLSLGADFGPADDPENELMEELYRNGILTVVAAGNANGYNGVGDTYSILGNPGNTVSSLTVANSIGSYAYGDKAEILAPSSVAGDVYGDYSLSFDYTKASEEELTGEVVMTTPENPYACDPYPANVDFGGKWVFIDWSDETGDFPCGSAVRFNNIEAAGGKGVVLASQVVLESTGIAGNETIPGVRLNSDYAEKVREAVKKGGVKIKVDANNIGAAHIETGARDTLNPSSSRGQHGSLGFTKPDVAAPGTSIKSAAVAGGSAPTIMTGTSMAAPHVAGIAALVAEAHPEYSPAEIKAAIMNTAGHDLRDDEGDIFSVERVGSGRVDARDAVETDVLLYNADRPEQVSTSFGVVEIQPGETKTFTRKFAVENKGNSTRTFDVDFATSSPLNGVSVSAPDTVTVAAGSTATITLTATVDGSELVKELDPATQERQLDVVRQYISSYSSRLLLTDGNFQLRAPVQMAPKPVSDMSVSELKFTGSEPTTTVQLEGTALNQGGYTSALGAFELGYESPRIATNNLAIPSAQAADLQYVGANSTLPARIAAGGSQGPTGPFYLNFGLTSWGNWETMSRNFTYEVDIDINNDGVADFYVITSRTLGLDYPIAELYQRQKDGSYESIDTQKINGVTGEVDTNLMDTNAMVLPVDLEKLNITAEQAANLRYSVYSASWSQSELIDQTGWISYNPLKPNLAFGADQTLGTSLFVDDPETELTAYRGSNSSDVRALFLHMHNASGDLSGTRRGEDGAKAQVVKVKQATVFENLKFVDVPADHAFYKEISWLASQGIADGRADGTFRPDQPVTRGEMAAFLYRLAGSPEYTAPSTSPFKDVSVDNAFYKEISWLKDQDIAGSWASRIFRPNQPVSRSQLADFLYRMSKDSTYIAPANAPFKDVPPKRTFYKQISWLKERGITDGWLDKSFSPNRPVTRAETALSLYRFNENVLTER